MACLGFYVPSQWRNRWTSQREYHAAFGHTRFRRRPQQSWSHRLDVLAFLKNDFDLHRATTYLDTRLQRQNQQFRGPQSSSRTSYSFAVSLPRSCIAEANFAWSVTSFPADLPKTILSMGSSGNYDTEDKEECCKYNTGPTT